MGLLTMEFPVPTTSAAGPPRTSAGLPAARPTDVFATFAKEGGRIGGGRLGCGRGGVGRCA
ncbi:sulfate adenylyltransferase [Streptomyces prasinopilosus]|uniref:Uncharacterized protein n=1 Tax=Streptomyces prasinopilosus TaxID=67344 RepID=A0A1G6LM71_9ACTN|nr:sulfate adenylyltransferase [Streptomyces prasinopilosus]SDC44147.1 hypothetical protein SAMN05216505_102170 [Streptomyces prasinopilosus]